MRKNKLRRRLLKLLRKIKANRAESSTGASFSCLALSPTDAEPRYDILSSGYETLYYTMMI